MASAAVRLERNADTFVGEACLSAVRHPLPSRSKDTTLLPRRTSKAVIVDGSSRKSALRRKLSADRSTADSTLDGTMKTASTPATEAYTPEALGVGMPNEIDSSPSASATATESTEEPREKSDRSRPILSSSASVSASVTGTNESVSRSRFTTFSSALPENGAVSCHASFVRTSTVGGLPRRTTSMRDTESEGVSSTLRRTGPTPAPREQSTAKCAAASRTIPASSMSMERRLLTTASS